MSESFRDRVDASDLKKNAQREAEARAIIEHYLSTALGVPLSFEGGHGWLDRARKWLEGKHE